MEHHFYFRYTYLRYHLKQEISETEVLKCITPKAIYVCRDASDRKIAILCDSMVDDEHGIALLFINEKCQGMIQQDEIV